MTLYSVLSIGLWFAVAVFFYKLFDHYKRDKNTTRFWRFIAVIGGCLWCVYAVTGNYDDHLKNQLGCYENIFGKYECTLAIDWFYEYF